MKYSIDKQEKYLVLKLEEEKLDSEMAPKFKSEILTLHAEGFRNFIINMSEVKYVDSSGLSSILVGNRLATEDNGEFILCALTEHVEKLIGISQLDKVLNILPTEQEAIDNVLMSEIEKDLGSSDN